ncbi:MAG: hypothetical protein C5B50_22255 [Verrucomicrobia bacterium]|nr:MAG: hypothetical protein C5B50_22255 [Verrucomicrobiota bacterium]
MSGNRFKQEETERTECVSLFPLFAPVQNNASPAPLSPRSPLLTLSPLFTLLTLLAGCSVGPNYHPPTMPAGAAFSNGGQTNFAVQPITIEWWKQFNDPHLTSLIERAISSNLDVRVATARVREARALRSQAVADYFPAANANASYTKSAESRDSLHDSTTSQRYNELWNAGFDATWELDIFGRVRRSVEASSADLGATIANRQDVLLSLMAEIARNYFELRGTRIHLEVARKNAENQRQTLDLTETKFRAGRATELDAARARAELTSTLAAIPPLESDVKHAIHRLSVLLGQLPAALDSELGKQSPAPAQPTLINIGNPADLLRRRPDIRVAERNLAAATARIGVETADLFPRVTFNGNVAMEANTIGEFGGAGSDSYSFGPKISWAALDFGHVRARIKAANARADAELALYEKTVLNALEDTENALVDIGREQARRELLRQSDRAATEATDLARQRYEGGIADFLPVLDAERTQLDIQVQLARSNTQVVLDLIALYKALGGGWESAPPPS